MWGELGIEAESKVKQNKGGLHSKDDCVQRPERSDGLSSLHPSARAADEGLLHGTHPLTVLAPCTFYNLEAGMVKESKKQKTKQDCWEAAGLWEEYTWPWNLQKELEKGKEIMEII